MLQKTGLDQYCRITTELPRSKPCTKQVDASQAKSWRVEPVVQDQAEFRRVQIATMTTNAADRSNMQSSDY